MHTNPPSPESVSPSPHPSSPPPTPSTSVPPDDMLSRPPPPPKPDVARLRIFALTSGLIGLQFCWAVQVGYVTKSLLELGLPERFVSYAWLAGPIAGVIVQPIVGVLSDRCTSSYGRRRPYLVLGTISAALCLLLFAYAEQIGQYLGDPSPSSDEHISQRPRAMSIAVLAFWMLDFAINAAQGPLRALMADVLPPKQHKLGNSYFALATGLGNCSGSLLGSVPLANWLTIFPDDLQALYFVAAVVLMTCMGVTVFSVKEVPLGGEGYEQLAQAENGYGGVERVNATTEQVDFFKAATVAPHPFWETFLVQCFTWFGWFTMFVYATSWVGKDVFKGSFDAAKGTEERELYDAGVRMGNLGIGLQSVLTIISSLILPKLLERWSMGIVFFVSHLLLGSALTLALFLHDKSDAWIATAMLASTGFSWAITMTVPWSLMSEAVAQKAPERAGIYSTMFNLSQCFPEIVVSLVAEEVIRVTGSQAAVLGLGGMMVYIGGALIVLLRLGIPSQDEGKDKEDEIQAEPSGVTI